MLFDFRGHGESGKCNISFGFYESNDVRASLDFIKSKTPSNEIFIIGTSMGAAAVAVSEVGDQVKGIIFEQMYPTLDDAIKDRIEIRLGCYFRFSSILLTCQVTPRLGISVNKIAPIKYVGSIQCKKMFIVGKDDRHTKHDESIKIFDAASSPKEFVVIDCAEHVDLQKYDAKRYAQIVLPFLTK